VTSAVYGDGRSAARLHCLTPLSRRLGRPHSRSACRAVQKNLSFVGNRTPAVQPTAIPTELAEP
jgi:hypothetical protein